MKSPLLVLLLSIALPTGTVPSSLRAAEPSGDPLGSLRFAPTLALERSDEIGLTPEQRERIEGCLRLTQEQYPILQEALLGEMEKLETLQRADPIDESAARQQFVAVLEKENAIKLLQFTLLNQVRNILEPAQVELLRKVQHGRSAPAGKGAVGGGHSGQIEAIQRQIEQARAAGAPPEQIRQMAARLQKQMATGAAGAGGAGHKSQVESIRKQIEQARAAGAPPEQIRQMEAQLHNLMNAVAPGDSGPGSRHDATPN